MNVTDGRMRAVIERIEPAVDGGRFAAKRIAGDAVVVEADCYTDGHDTIACLLLWRREGAAAWRETPMAPLGNDRWRLKEIREWIDEGCPTPPTHVQ